MIQSIIDERLLRSFPAPIRLRGERYFREGRVRLIRVETDAVHAVVRGSSDYVVRIASGGPSRARMSCDCPYAEDHGLCKHIYAAALEARTRAHESTTDRPLHGRASENPKIWQRRLSGIRRNFGEAAKRRRAARPEEDRASRPLEKPLVYRLQFDQTSASGGVVVEVQSGDRRIFSNEAWLKSRDRADRQTARLLLGGEPVGYFIGQRVPASIRRFTIPPALYGTTLRRICETGRCSVVLPKAKEDSPAPLATWDAGGRWGVRFAVEPTIGPSGDAATWQLRGWLVRGDERVPVEDASVLAASGLALTKTGFARLQVGRSWPLLLSLRTEGPLEVPAEALFDLAAQLALLPGPTHVQLPPGTVVEQAGPVPQPRVQIGQPDPRDYSPLLPLRLSFDYDGVTVAAGRSAKRLIDRERKRIIHRDPERELAARDRLVQLGGTERTGWRSDRKGQLQLHPKRLDEVVRTLVGEGWYVEADGRIHRAATATEARVRSGIDWFDLEGGVSYGDQVAPLAETLAALRRGERVVQLGDGSVGLLPIEWLRRFAPLAEFALAHNGQEQGPRIRFRRRQAALLDALLAEQPEVRADETFARIREGLRGFERVKPTTAPRGFRGELRPYQKDGLGWMAFLRRLELGGCLADDMGLGKTVQVLALLERRRQEGAWPSLVVVPKSLVFNWMSEAARFAPRLRVRNYTVPDRHSERLDSESCDVVISTYGTLRRDAPELAAFPFDYVILDEAQAIKNASSASAKAARLLTGRHRLALSGTPIENHLGELWSLFEFLNPGLLGSAKAFAALRPGARGGGPDEATRALLARAVRPFLLRRTKEQVAPELPTRTEQTLFVELEGEQRKQYDALRDHYRRDLLGRVASDGIARSKMRILEALLRLRQMALHPGLVDARWAGSASAKLPLLLEALEEVVAEGHRALVFSQFTTFLALVREALDNAGIAYEYLDGSTRDRQERVTRFQQDGGPPVFLISLRAGGHGLNLTAADYVFLLDPWWNPAVEAQAIDRTHRIGQSKPVVAMRLIAKDTVEEKVLALQQSKRELADAVLGEDAGLLSRITREDLELLLG